MTGPPAAVAAVRCAVRAELADIASGRLVLAAVSGGPDSLALAAALAFEAPRAGLRAGAVVIDHQLQPGSDVVAGHVAATLRSLGLDPVVVDAVDVRGAGGPEAAARTARYAALDAVAARLGVAAVLLGHTRDDQAETVLLRLARGSGARSLAGMPARSGLLRRPLLGLSREQTLDCCAESGLEPWQDPHNADPAFARVRVRNAALPALTEALGPGVVAALARTADLLRDDDDALEDWAGQLLAEAAVGGLPAAGLDAAVLGAAPAAVRRRALRRAVIAAGCCPGSLTSGHLSAVDALVADWHGQGAVDLPGGIRAARRCGRLHLTPAGGGAPPTGPEE